MSYSGESLTLQWFRRALEKPTLYDANSSRAVPYFCHYHFPLEKFHSTVRVHLRLEVFVDPGRDLVERNTARDVLGALVVQYELAIGV